MKKKSKYADTTSSLRQFLLWVCVAVLTMGTYAIAAQTINSKLKSKQITLRSFAVVPPKVEATKSGKNEMTPLAISYLKLSFNTTCRFSPAHRRNKSCQRTLYAM